MKKSIADFFEAYKLSQILKKTLIFVIVGAFLGLAYSIFLKPKYTATCTFVLEDANHEGLISQYSGLASLAGLDLGNTNGGMFKGENIFDLYKSRLMLEQTLLSDVNINNKHQKLIDWYIQINHLQKKWRRDDDIDSINFNGDPKKFNMKQDSLVTDITETIDKDKLIVTKPDKKLSTIKIEFIEKNQAFAKNFTDKLVETVNNFYVNTKTKKALQNYRVLQFEADSVKIVLNRSLNGAASAYDAAPNPNPSLTALRVPTQKKQVDIQSNSAIYAEVVKNLELSKISVRQQTPLIQYIDQPVLPLKSNKISKKKGVFIGGFLGLFIIASYYFARFIQRLLIQEKV
jgi:hypothetical protein